ncbi:MAG: helicase-exonuclease AddAB subunit AddA [Agathobacter sp.]|nr:helicase-exonuclease AddAB subunit AddA [Agathobacter sp.]
MKWTKEQQNVIEFRNRNILVSAAAGSGKTAVLVERIIQKITDETQPVDIDRLLVVTFTKAAAAEMRERIGNAIEKLLEEQPENENLRRQQTLLHNAQITTIDSFCLFVVRNHFEEIGLEPNFRIADPGEIKLLEMDVLNEVFEQEYQRHANTLEAEQCDDSFLQLVDAYSDKRSNKAVKDMVSKIYTQSASNPWPKEWVQSLIQPYMVASKEELLETDLMQGIYSYVKTILLDMPAQLEAFREMALSEPGLEKYALNIEKDLEAFAGLEAVEDFEELGVFCQNLCTSMGNLTAIRGFEGNVEKKEAVSNGRNGVKKEIKGIYERYFSMSLEELVEQLGRMRGIAEELVRLTLLYMEALEKKKQEKHLMDFSDIEHAALRILVDEEKKEHRSCSLEFQQQFEEIMIDEYQDSNQVQEEIMRAISRESLGEYNMFMVGDVKQSIYRFRLARPELFMEKFASYDLEESKKQRIDLHKNFRSRQEVLDFTNDMFYKIMAPDLGNVAYDAEAALYYGAGYEEAQDMNAEVLLYETDAVVEESGSFSQGDDADGLGKRQLEARMVAQRILELKETLQVTDKATGQLRPLRNSDIVILLRSLSGWGNEFASVLEDCGIPAHVSTSTGYFSAVEVQTVLSFLKILDNPYQDIPMAAVLKSAIVGLDNEELAEVSLAEGATSFAEAALMKMEAASEGKLYHFQQLYQRLRAKVMDTPIHQMIDMVLEETGYGDYVKALPAGAQRKANLDMLVEKAIAYEKTSYKGLFHFIRYIDQLQKYEVDFGEADVIGENEDVVRLMTIHKSKGLEFPVVFVSGISKQFNERDSKEKLAIHPDMGLGLDEVQISPRVKRKCLIRSEIAERIRRDNLGEELRVLYVALTRAKEKLILTGTVKNQEKLYDSYMGNLLPGVPLSFSQRTQAKGYIDWIAPAVLSYPEKYRFTFVNAEDLVLASVKDMAEKTIAKEVLLEQIYRADEVLVETYRKRFAYKYPYMQDMARKSKYSVSELKHDSMVENYDRMEGEVGVPEFLLEERQSYIPEFARPRMEETVDYEKDDVAADIILPAGVNRGALRGTAVHRVMECMNFAAFLEVDQKNQNAVMDFITKELDRMVPELLTKEQYVLVDMNKLLRFFESPIARRMAEADRRGDLFREKPFVMDYEGVLLQGIIDVFWLEEDQIVLLDYKTDRVQTEDELKQRYQKQLELYAEALCRIFSTKERKIDSTENLIYSFCFNKEIELKGETL